MGAIEDFVMKHEVETLTSQEGELLTQGLSAAGGKTNLLCITNNCKGGNCAAGCGISGTDPGINAKCS